MAPRVLRLLLASSLVASPLAEFLRAAPKVHGETTKVVMKRATVSKKVAVEEAAPKTATLHRVGHSAEVDETGMAPPRIMVVMVVGDREEAEAAREEEASGPFAVNSTCAKEMEQVSSNQAQFAKSHECEAKTGYSTKAVDALRDAKPEGALGFVEKTFHECAGISADCAKQVAPGVVLKMRLSGVAISDSCKKVAGSQTAPKENSEACRQNMTQGMTGSLQKQDLDGAMSAAQHGLHSCQKIEAPCDFQLAPVVVMQMLQASMQQEQQQITEVLLAGLHKAQEMSEQVTLGTLSPVHERTTRVKAEGKYAPAAKNQTKQVALLQQTQLSLLDLNLRMRIEHAKKSFV